MSGEPEVPIPGFGSEQGLRDVVINSKLEETQKSELRGLTEKFSDI